MKMDITCFDCRKKFSSADQIFRCPECRGSLDIIIDYKKIKKSISLKKLKERDFDHRRYKEFYPVKNLPSIGEGGTPLIRSKNIEKKYKLKFNLFFKNETVNPTGSFKDRGSSVEVGRAIDLGKGRAVCASTGNMGASAAAYCAISNIGCDIFTPKDAAGVKVEQIIAYGANVFKVRGTFTEAEKMSEAAFEKYGVYLLGDYLYRREGTKSVGFEIMEQMDFKTDKLHIISPVGNGILISSLYKSGKEFREIGFVKKLPKISGIQASGCSPVVDAFDSGRKIMDSDKTACMRKHGNQIPINGSCFINREKIVPEEEPKTIAGAMKCGNPLDGSMALDAIRKTEGWADTVTDGEILEMRRVLAREEGIFAEPAGAASLAGIIKRKKWFNEDDDVICLVTGNGLKTPYTGINKTREETIHNDKYLQKIFNHPLVGR